LPSSRYPPFKEAALFSPIAPMFGHKRPSHGCSDFLYLTMKGPLHFTLPHLSSLFFPFSTLRTGDAVLLRRVIATSEGDYRKPQVSPPKLFFFCRRTLPSISADVDPFPPPFLIQIHPFLPHRGAKYSDYLSKSGPLQAIRGPSPLPRWASSPSSSRLTSRYSPPPPLNLKQHAPRLWFQVTAVAKASCVDLSHPPNFFLFSDSHFLLIRLTHVPGPACHGQSFAGLRL